MSSSNVSMLGRGRQWAYFQDIALIGIPMQFGLDAAKFGFL